MLRWSFGIGIVAFACESTPQKSPFDQGPEVRGKATSRLTEPDRVAINRPDFAGPVDRARLGQLRSKERLKLDRSPVPVLIPTEPAWLKKAVITVGEHWYALSVNHDGVSVSLHATRVAHHHPDTTAQRPDRSLRGTRAFVGPNEGIWNVSWQERKVAYSLDVECGAPSDQRCRDEKFALRVAEALVFAGGSGVRP